MTKQATDHRPNSSNTKQATDDLSKQMWIRKEPDADGFFLLQLGKQIDNINMFLTCQWVCEETDCVLVTTSPYIKGLECEAIIDFTTMQEPDVLSRATIRVIKGHGVMKQFIEFEELLLAKMLGM